jgi:hypothetical protein
VPGVTHRQLALCSDGTLGTDEGVSGKRTFMSLGAGLNPRPAQQGRPAVVAGHRLRLILTSDDQDPKFPADMNFRRASVGTSSLNRVASSSRLLLPVSAGTL